VHDAIGRGEATIDELRAGRVGLDSLPAIRKLITEGYARRSVFRPNIARNLFSTPDERFELLEMVRQSATRLHTLYTKSLTLGALRSGQRLLDTASVDIWELAEDAIAVMTPQAAAKEVELALSGTEATPTQLDSQLIHDVIVALLANAIRVSPSPGRVEVRVWQDSEHLYISVSDQGPGIDPTFLPYVFEPFAQPDLCHHSSGQGLSLAIAHAVLEAHSGTIGVESESGQGARFTFRLPVVSR
jgi:NtrC-family two-component system sensor histidine kinase KinB